MEIRRMSGDRGEAAVWAGRLFDVSGGWEVMLWDVPRAERREALPRALAGAELYLATSDGVTVACAWVRPALPGSRTGIAHFCSLGGPEALAAGRAFLVEPALTAQYAALLGIIPAPYRHARRFVRELGFTERLIPGLCCLPERERPVPGALVTRNL